MSVGATWSGSHEFTASRIVEPRTVDSLRMLIRTEPRVRALGTRHSFSDIADSSGILVDLGRWTSEPELDSASGRVRIRAGLRYGDLAVWLHEHGRALANMASLPHISVGGAVATGTHGSGVSNGSLATAVASLQLVDGRGEVVRVSRADADFNGVVVGLGLLGVVTHLELDTEPAFEVAQEVHEGLGWERLLGTDGLLDEVLSSAYSVSIFTRWTGDDVGQVWTKSRTGSVHIAGAHPAGEQRHMIAGMPTDLTTPQLGVAGPWHERLPHFKLGFLPSHGDELQSEYLLPRERAVEALRAIRELADDMEPLLHVTEVRAIAGDELWLSGAYGADTVALHFTWLREPERVNALLPRIEALLLPLGARPHWGKVFTAEAAQIAPLYPRWREFAALAKRYDPGAKFTNAWTARTLGL